MVSLDFEFLYCIVTVSVSKCFWSHLRQMSRKRDIASLVVVVNSLVNPNVKVYLSVNSFIKPPYNFRKFGKKHLYDQNIIVGKNILKQLCFVYSILMNILVF